MNLLGYLVTLTNIQSFQSSGGPIKDLSIDVADIKTLSDDLTSNGLNLDKFRDTGYYKNGCVGKYLSKNLRDYIYDGLGDPTDEALILTIHFTNDTTREGEMSDDGSLSFLVHKSKVDEDDTLAVKSYIDSLRQKRSTVDMLRP
ncbi:hypothetical protein ACJJTC_007708 [Scirpophaga incertulas]